MSYTNPVLIGGGPSQQSVYEVATEARHRLGTRGRLPDGREFEYVRSQNSTAIGHGKLATYEPMAAAADQIAPEAAAVGATSVTLSSVAITFTANELAGGFLNIEDAAGEGELYPIIGNEASTATSDMVVTLGRPIVTALTTSSDVSIVTGPTAVKISAAVTAQATAAEVAAGVPLVDIPAGDTDNQYFWVQKSGLASVLFGTVVGSVGDAVYHGEDAGSFQAMTMDHADTTDRDEKMALGTVFSLLPVDTEYHVVNLQIA